jgi:hypothetical protein
LYLCSGKQRALSKVLVELYHVVYFTSWSVWFTPWTIVAELPFPVSRNWKRR